MNITEYAEYLKREKDNKAFLFSKRQSAPQVKSSENTETKIRIPAHSVERDAYFFNKYVTQYVYRSIHSSRIHPKWLSRRMRDREHAFQPFPFQALELP